MTFDLTINTQNILSEIVTEDNSVSFEVAIGNLLKGQGYTEKGEWDELTHYMPYDVVHYLNSVYVCLVENEGSLPTNVNTDWEMWLDSTEFLNKSEAQVITGIKEFQNGLKVGGHEEIGTFSLNEEDLTIDLSMKDGVMLQLGQEFLVPIRNGENDILMNGEIVYTETTIGNSSRLVVKRFLGNGDTGMTTIGMITHDIESGEDGYATILGKVRGIDTSMWNDGDLLYPHPTTAGALTNVLPIAPKTKTIVGRVVKAHTNGTIFIRPINAMNLWNASDVLEYNPETLTENSILLWDATNKRWVAKTSISELTTTSKTIVGAINEVNAWKIDKTSIKQALGTSTSDVISQKATTDNLELKIDKESITGVFGQDATKVISQKGFTDNISEILQLEGEELWAYGVKWNQGQESATLERIGNLNMHKTLPCHKTRGCLVKDDTTINYYLHDSTDFLKEDGVTPSVLDGTDGDVMNYRKFYYRTAIKDGVHVNWMSPYPLQGYTLYEGFTGRYRASINRTTGKIHSVINTTPEFRGGGNNAAWDSDGRSLLGCAVSGINRATFRSGARINRSTDWNGARGHDDNFALLIYFRVKWATHNTQLAYNPALDANGYHQGGMGNGTTNLNSTKWNGYNGYNPFIPCGYTAEFGNGSGVKDFVMPFEYDGYNTTLSQQKYVGVHDSERVYAVGEYVSDSFDTYKGSGDALLYICIVDAPAGTLLTNTTYFSVVNRTVTQAIRMDGEEQWFGEIWEHYANVIIEHNADVEPKTSKAYIFRNPGQIAEIRTGDEEFLCDLPISDGYIKEFNSNSIFPISVGGGSITYGCDYYYCNYPASGIALRGCLGSGSAYYAAYAGASCSNSYYSPSFSYAYVGGRLVLKKRKIENQ